MHTPTNTRDSLNNWPRVYRIRCKQLRDKQNLGGPQWHGFHRLFIAGDSRGDREVEIKAGMQVHKHYVLEGNDWIYWVLAVSSIVGTRGGGGGGWQCGKILKI